jgi:hypothetical protein
VSDVFVAGCGVVSPAGWGMTSFREALNRGAPIEIKEMIRPGLPRRVQARPVPPPASRPAYFGHARFRRTSPIAQFAVAAAVEALGGETLLGKSENQSLGVVLTVMSGSVNYSRRFYDETLKNPATASPLVFPETVFNAPASHLAAMIGTTAINYTLVGDPGTFLQGIALAADWLASGRVEACLVVAAEEQDWTTAEAFSLFERNVVVSAGAGALCLRRQPRGPKAAKLLTISEPQLYSRQQSRAAAARQVRSGFGIGNSRQLLCDGLTGLSRLDADEQGAWQDWTGPRISPKTILGESMAAAPAWQCIAAIETAAATNCTEAIVSVVGCNQQAIAAQFAIT